MLLAVAFSAMAAAPGPVVLVPMGNVDRAFLEAAAEAVRARVEADVRIDPPRELPRSAWYEPRRRYRAEKLLDAIDAAPPEGAWKVLVVTAAEISTTKGDIQDWGIAGLGNIGGRSSVASTFLYTKHSKTKAQALKRFTDVAVHEFGHTLRLPHCETTGCVMADAKGKAMRAADVSRGHFCLRCRQAVEAGVLKPLAW
jgi:archaemetzincin